MSEVITRPAAGKAKSPKATHPHLPKVSTTATQSSALDAALRKTIVVLQTLLMCATRSIGDTAFPRIPELDDADAVFSHLKDPVGYDPLVGAPADVAGQLRTGHILLDAAISRINDSADNDVGIALHLNVLMSHARTLAHHALVAYNAGDIHELQLLTDFVYLVGTRGYAALPNKSGYEHPHAATTAVALTANTPTSAAGAAGADLMRDATYLVDEIADGIVSLGEECRAVGDHRMWGMLNCFGHRIIELNGMLMSHFDNDGRSMVEAHSKIYSNSTAFNLGKGVQA